MAFTRRTAQKSTGRQPTRQLAPRNVPPPPEPQPDSPLYVPLGVGFLRDCGHGTGRGRHAGRSTTTAKQQP
jgi:hypothetical protein